MDSSKNEEGHILGPPISVVRGRKKKILLYSIMDRYTLTYKYDFK